MQTHEHGNLRLTKIGPLGPYDNNAYIIADRQSNEALIVDMPYGSEPLIEAARGFQVRAILLTHTHPDHWAEYDKVKEALDAPVLCHPAEVIMPAAKIDEPLADQQKIEVGGLAVTPLHTPGHTPGSTCFVVGRYLLSGDVLFPGGPGNTRGDAQRFSQIIDSISSRLFTMPEDTVVYPGHGKDTTIGTEKPHLQEWIDRGW